MSFSSQKKSEGSGSAKLRAHRERSSSSSSGGRSRAESPTEYNNRVEAEKASTSNTVSSGSDLKVVTQAESNSVPTPVKNVEAWRNEQLAKKQVVNETSPHVLYGSDATERKNITSEPKTDVRNVSEDVTLNPERASFTGDVRTSLNNQVQTGQEGVKGVHVSNTSQKLMDVGTSLVSKTEQYKETAKIIHPTDVMQNTVVPSVMKSVASVGDMFLRAPAGTEVFVQRPTLLPTAVSVAALGTVDYTIDTAKNDPIQLVSDAAVFSALGYGIGKAGTTIKSKVPAIATGEQGILLKTSISESPIVNKVGIEPTTFVEYKGSAFGQDIFNIKKFNTELTTIKPKPKGAEVLIGETKGGYTDVYTPVTESQAAAISQNYYAKTRNIKTSEGSFLEIEPTGKIETPIYEKSGQRISTSQPELIGNSPESSTLNLQNKYRIEKRVDVQKGELSISNSDTLQLPEFTQTLNSKGKVINDFNIHEFYKNSEVEPIKQLESGHAKQNIRKSLVNDESGNFNINDFFEAPLKDKVRGYTMQEKPTYVGDMPEMNIKMQKASNKVSLKESKKTDIAEVQKLYDEASARNSDPVSNKVSLKRVNKQNKNTFGIFADFRQDSTISISDGLNIPELIQYPKPSPNQSSKPAIRSVSSSSKSSKTPDATTTKGVLSIALEVPKMPVKVPKDYNKDKSKKKKLPKDKKEKWDYDRLINEYKNPLNMDVKKWV